MPFAASRHSTEPPSSRRIDLKLHEIVPHAYAPRWNVPPTEMLPVITSKDGKRRLEPMVRIERTRYAGEVAT